MPLQPKKTNRDYPLSTTPEPVILRDELLKRNSSGTFQKLMNEENDKRRASIVRESKVNDSIRNKAMKELRDKRMKDSM